MKKIGIGIMGAGYMGQTHAKTYANLDSAKIVGVADIDFSKAKDLANKYHCNAFKDYEELLDIPEIDAVSICTPDAIHKEPVIFAARRNKHILLEKPIATNLEDAESIAKAVKESGIIFQIDFVERFNKTYIVAQKALHEGAIGKLISIRSQRMNVRYASEYLVKRGDNIISFFGIHDIDLFHWFAGQIKKISVEAGRYTFPEYPPHDDAALILVRFESGALGLIQLTWGLINSMPFKASSKLELIGDKGMINIDTVDHSVTINSEKGFNNLIGWDRSSAFNEQLSYFLDCIKENKPPKVGVEQGLSSLKISLLAQECVKTGKSIII